MKVNSNYICNVLNEAEEQSHVASR